MRCPEGGSRGSFARERREGLPSTTHRAAFLKLGEGVSRKESEGGWTNVFTGKWGFWGIQSGGGWGPIILQPWAERIYSPCMRKRAILKSAAWPAKADGWELVEQEPESEIGTALAGQRLQKGEIQ